MDFFYQPEIINGSDHLTNEESRHCCKVLRKKEGDAIHVLDGNGGSYLCKLITADSKKTVFEVLDKKITTKPEFSINIAISPTKSMDRMEWFIEKTVEIGIDNIYLVSSNHSERKILKLERLIKKAISAMKQSGNLFLPEIHQLISFRKYLKLATKDSEKFICHQESGKGSFLTSVASANMHYYVLIGPEGDFSNDELNHAQESNYRPVSLGNSRLRTETAGIVACTLLQGINIQK